MKTIKIITLVISIFIISCEKEEVPSEPILVTLNKNALEFLKTTPGKYLIYKDSATSQIDSIIITKCELKKIYYPENNSNDLFTPNTPAYYGDQFEINYIKKTTSNISPIWFKSISNAYYNYHSDTTNQPLLFVDYLNEFIWFGGSFYYDESTVILPSYNVNGKIYYNVIVHKTSNGLDGNHPSYFKTEYFWANQIGIIQKSIETTGYRQTFFLIRNN